MSSSKSRAKGRQKQNSSKKAQPKPPKAIAPVEVVPAAPTITGEIVAPQVQPAPVAPGPVVASPVVAKPAVSKPAVAKPIAAKPVAKSVVTPTASAKPMVAKPVAVESTSPEAAPPSDRFWMGALALMVIAIVLRQVQLGHGPFHDDENIHIFFSQGFPAYQYNPVFHGPLLYHLVSSVFAAFGQHDYTARLVPSLLGIGLIALVLGPARRWMGERGSLAAAALLAVSPSVVTYSRILFHDALVLDLTLGSVLCFITALHYPATEKRGRWALFGLAACLSLFLATKANFFFVFVVILAFWIAWLVRGKVRLTFPFPVAWPAALFALVTFAAIAFPRVMTGREDLNETQLDQLRASQHQVFQIVAVLGCALLLTWTMTRPANEGETQGRERWKNHNDWVTWVLAAALAVWIYVFMFGQGANIIAQWATTHQFPSAAFASGQESAKSAIPKMLDYWGGQQMQPRLGGRHDYYMVLGLLYELPIFVVALGGIWHASKKRGVWSDFLLWWAFASWVVYAVANEKVPWLLVHILLPLALLGAGWLASLNWKRPLFFAATMAGLCFALRSDAAMIFERAGDHYEPLLYAQTPDMFRDTIQEALEETRGDSRPVWINNNRQWPSWWYLRKQDNPPMGQSGVAMGDTATGGAFQPDQYRAFVAMPADLDKWTNREGWRLKTVDYWVWPRASWEALQPARYWRWFWTRQTIEPDEKDKGALDSPTSILAGHGEWSYQPAVIGSRIER